jgi:diguanylate cyclase (GGDEF)-like protein
VPSPADDLDVRALALSTRHFSGIATRPLFERVEACFGDDGLNELVALAGEQRSLAALRDETGWHTYAQMRALLQAGAVMLEGCGGLEAIGSGRATLTQTTLPEVTAAIARFGSPEAMITAENPTATALFPALEFDVELLAPGHARYQWRLIEGLEPFPELCALLRGLMPTMVHLFGCRVVEVRADACQCWGDHACSHDLRWEGGDDLALRAETADMRRHLAEMRLEAYQRSVEDLVSAPDLESALARIIDTVAHNVQAVSVILEVGLDPVARHLHVAGISEEDARQVLADPPPAYSVVDVASMQRAYGHLVVGGPSGLIGLERPALVAFAKLAASALDSAFAVEDARRQANAAETLLALSRSITALGTVREIGAKVAEAVAVLVDCDRAYVVLSSDGTSEVIGCAGMDEASAAAMQARSYEFVDRPHDEIWFERDAAMQDASVSFVSVARAGFSVLVDDRVLAVAVGVTTRPERLFDEPRLAELLSGLAAHASVALRNERLVEQIRHQSLHDPLTGLPNRTLVLDRAEQMLARCRRTGEPVAALFIDLDGFKEINDTLGHTVGDQLLAVIAERLAGAVRANDTVGRLGGDEFVILTEGSSLDEGVDAIASRILEVLREPLQLSERERPLAVSASIGVAVGDRSSASELLRDADIALYRAKAAGKSCARVFEPSMAEDVRRRAELYDDLVGALAREEFFLLFQPVLDLHSGRVKGVEALLRWSHPVHGVLDPGAFIPLLEQSDLILGAGRWVLHEACRHAAAWRAAGQPLEVAVNASVRQLERADFVQDVRDALLAFEVLPSSLVIEITETAIMHDTDAAIIVLTALKELGVRLSIDDFGTGYCSLSYLSQFPVDALKIDQVFVEGITRSVAGGELVHTLVRLGRALGLDTYAEGIETAEQLERVRAEGCELGQGFYFAGALHPESILAFVAEREAKAATR